MEGIEAVMSTDLCVTYQRQQIQDKTNNRQAKGEKRFRNLTIGKVG